MSQQDNLLNQMKSPLDTLIDEMNATIDETSIKRAKLTERMMLYYEEIMDPKAVINPDDCMSRVSVAGELRQLLDSQDKAKLVKVNTQLKKKSEETNANLSKVAAEALKQLKPIELKEYARARADGGFVVDTSDEDLDSAIDKALNDGGVEVTESELRDNHMDLSK